MGYFNYFIKAFIRVFTRKFFWLILIAIFIFLGFIVFSPKSNAMTTFTFEYNGNTYSVQAPQQEGKDATDLTVVKVSNYNQLFCMFGYDDLITYGVLNPFTSVGVNWFDFSYNNKYYRTYQYRLNLENSSLVYIQQGQSVENKLSNYASGSSFSEVVYSSVNVYKGGGRGNFTYNAQSQVYYQGVILPSFLTSEEDLASLNFDYFKIDGGTLRVANSSTYALAYYYDDVVTTIPISSNWFNINSNNTYTINIPKNALISNLPIKNASQFRFAFAFLDTSMNIPIVKTITTNTLYWNLTEEDINKLAQEQQLGLMQGQIDATDKNTKAVEDLNKTMTDSNVDNEVLNDMPQAENINDNTGIATIFQNMYNAFCTDEPIVFTLTIPFVNKSITIDSNYANNYPQGIRSLASVFWWFVIGLYVIKDVRTIINKIAEGNVENVGSDVQKEVL